MVAAVAMMLSGCAKEEPPKPLTVAELPAALEKAFAKAPAERKEIVARSVSALQAGQIPNALLVIESVCAIPDLTEEQRSAASRALLTLNQELQASAAKGDKAATDFQKLRQAAH
jgi:uncharacterized protein YjiK